MFFFSFHNLLDMMPWMMPYLRFVDDSLKSSFQESLSLMRKNRLFCDVILQVSFQLIPSITINEAHRKFLNFYCNNRLKTQKFMLIATCWLAFHLI